MSELTVETFRPEPAHFARAAHGGTHERLREMGRAYLSEHR